MYASCPSLQMLDCQRLTSQDKCLQSSQSLRINDIDCGGSQKRSTDMSVIYSTSKFIELFVL